MEQMLDLRHEFVLCDNKDQECLELGKHCKYGFCGAPEDHPLHIKKENHES